MEGIGGAEVAPQAPGQPVEILNQNRAVQTHFLSGLLHQLLAGHDAGSGKHGAHRVAGGKIGD